jgi:uncharacterized protein YfaT (DUF1175 family)
VNRREFLAVLGALGAACAWDARAEIATAPLDARQSRAFRAWMVRIVAAQVEAGPTPRWMHRDCAGLVRFAAGEALRDHDDKWKRANGLAGQPLPPEVALLPRQQALRNNWRRADGTRDAYAGALELVQENTRLVARDCNLASPADLLFFDQGDAQHLMVWMGSFIAYHTGTVTPSDNGLRAVELRELERWPDTRWHPTPDNPNFSGIHRFAFLTA